MNAVLRRVGSIMSPVALLVAILALVVSAAGVGYAAGKVGTKQIKNNAVTAKKIKNGAVTGAKVAPNAVTGDKLAPNAVTGDKIPNGSLTAAELVASEVEKLATLSNGGEGDCVWTSGSALLPGLGEPTFRKDQFGTVHLSGIAIVADGPGGDASCNGGDPGQSSDATMFTLPAGYVPAHSMIVSSDGSVGIIIAGPLGLSDGGVTIAPGAVAPIAGVGGGLSSLDGISFQPVGSSVVLPGSVASGSTGSVGLLKLLSGN